jgi:hypothetical protein
VAAFELFKITYYDGTSETVRAAYRSWEKEGEWMTFSDGSGLILGVNTVDVKRVERTKQE